MARYQLLQAAKFGRGYSHNSFRTAMQLYRTSRIDDAQRKRNFTMTRLLVSTIVISFLVSR